MRRVLTTLALCALLVVGCSSPVSVERMCELNEEFAALNERTIPDIESDPFPEPAMLEQNFIEGNEVMREMVDVAPDEIRTDLTTHVEWAEKVSDLYAEFDYDREEVWGTMDEEAYVAEYSMDEAARKRIMNWFLEHCGMDLQG